MVVFKKEGGWGGGGVFCTPYNGENAPNAKSTVAK